MTISRSLANVLPDFAEFLVGRQLFCLSLVSWWIANDRMIRNKLVLRSDQHTCQIGKVQKREVSLFASYQRGRFCAKPFCDINFVHQHSNSSWNFENDEIFPLYNCLELIIWCITLYYCTLLILCWPSNAFSLQNSIQLSLLRRKW